MPNFMKIQRGLDFFFVDLAWNDPAGPFFYSLAVFVRFTCSLITLCIGKG